MNDNDEQRIRDLIRQELQDFIPSMPADQIAELANMLRGDMAADIPLNALRKIKRAAPTRFLNDGADINLDSTGTGVGHTGPTLPDIINVTGATMSLERGDGRQLNITVSGGGADCMFDYLVSGCWAAEVTAGRGTEGKVFTSLTGCTFRVYSTVQGAITHAQALTAPTSRELVFFICPGTYTENLTIIDSGASGPDHLVFWGTGAGDDSSNGCTIIDAAAGVTVDMTQSSVPLTEWHGLVLNAGVGGTAVRSASNGIAAKFFNCTIESATATANTSGWTDLVVDHCYIKGTWAVTGTAASVSGGQFRNCRISGGINFVGTGVTTTNLTILGCHFHAGAQILLRQPQNLAITGNTWVGTSTVNPIIISSDNSMANGISITGNSLPALSGAATAVIDITATHTVVINITGNNFDNTSGSAWNFVRTASGSLVVATITGNNFCPRADTPVHLEDDGGISISGVFVDSTFGLNTPADFDVELLAGSAANLYLGLGTVSGAGAPGTSAPSAITAEPFVTYGPSTTLTNARQYVNVEAGAPGTWAIRPEGATWFDTVANNLYVTPDGAGTWAVPMKFRVYTSLGESPVTGASV